MNKLWTIAWKELYTRFTDRNLILIMIATPLALSTIIGLAFGGLDSGNAPVRDIPVLVVNHDLGNEFGVNYGEVFLSLLVPGTGSSGTTGAILPACSLDGEAGNTQENVQVSLQELTEAQAFGSKQAQALVLDGSIPQPAAQPGSAAYVDSAAQAAVEKGLYTAAIVIPEDLSQQLSYSPANPSTGQTQVTVYADPGRPLSAGIIGSIAEGITNQIATGTIAITATLTELQAQIGSPAMGQVAGNLDFASAFVCAFDLGSNTISIDKQTVQRAAQENTGALILVAAGSAQAMFFALFTAQFGVLSMYEERRNWTLQRLIMSPTPRNIILGGKLVGVFVSVVFQLSMLFLALTLIGSLIQGKLTLIWGNQPALIVIVILAASLAVTGLGMLLAGIVKSPEQAQVFTSVLNIGLAVLGGAFGFALPRAISQLSMLYWGRNAFELLAVGQTGIWLNVLILAIQGAAMFAIGLFLFNRRFENV
jgi:ABC-type Na+ efflux pump permease subunit